MLRPLPRSTLFPYTTLFRSLLVAQGKVARLKGRDGRFGNLQLGGEFVLFTHRHFQQRFHVGELLFQILIRSEEHTSELQSLTNLVCRLLLEKKKNRLTNTEL